ncbi:MAG: GLUG motif-containing protein, partial [Candidatus Gastranaerophilales bacterium]|nr:GLUG motif-containing protein [Candidatus Gastranaerophilales bacterium]
FNSSTCTCEACTPPKVHNEEKTECVCPANSCATDGSQTTNSDCSCSAFCGINEVWDSQQQACVSTKCTDDMIKLYNAGDLAKIGRDAKYPLSGRYCLMNNIDLKTDQTLPATHKTAEGWIPIGIFSGVFEGNDKIISNLRINRPTGIQGLSQGLFSSMSSGSNINNLGVTNIDIYALDAGGLVSFNSGTITNCYVTGSVRAGLLVFYSAGGLVACNSGAITNSYAAVNVGGPISPGGLVGRNDNGTITNSYATGSVDIANSYSGNTVLSVCSWGGGLVGLNSDGTITNSYATAKVSRGDKCHGLGGLVGWNYGGTITNSYWDKQTSGQATSDGGKGKNTADMKTPATFSGWDTTIWSLVQGQYPKLKGVGGQ